MLFSIFRFGPLLNTWCMRMEAKNHYIKEIARITNFKNVPLSVAKRHQRLLCTYLQGDSFFTYYEMECGPCECSIELMFLINIPFFLCSFHYTCIYRPVY